ncbi:transcription termination/antitermination protein NusG [Ruminococcus sp.]|uniref:transcription termination/antitermination protein NusG n=1 Tax=Ruminococcus sp. TaxID=41978 RepID=UPI0025F65C2D|nr:transcription termination/antitermination protein NusG [Ruminococcus sp.]
MSEEAKWYVVHTYSGYENKVKGNIEKVVENRNLQELIPEVRIPMETVTEMKDNKPSEVEKKLFPSYVLVKMVLTDESWYIVRNTRGVTGFVGPASKPVPLSDKEVAALGVETSRSAGIEVSFKEGDSVMVTSGSFEGFTGTVEKFDMEAQTADVKVSMFGRETTVTLPLTQIKAED